MPVSQGLHHVTAMAADPRRNVAFYTRTLGLRLVKKTVNFDDPSVYHLYYGDETGTAGSILTFFPWPHAARGVRGSGEPVETAFLVPAGALDAWERRLADLGIEARREQRFGQARLVFADPDDMRLALVEAGDLSDSPGWAADGIDAEIAIRRIGGVTLAVSDMAGTARVLTDVFGYSEAGSEGDMKRFVSVSGSDAIDLRPSPPVRGRMGAGSVHHVAFRAATDGEQAAMAQSLVAGRIGVTEQKDRNYFRSVYFREPSGVLFEIATDEPGFAVDEAVEELGTALKLPAQYEAQRSRIEAVLPPLA